MGIGSKIASSESDMNKYLIGGTVLGGAIGGAAKGIPGAFIGGGIGAGLGAGLNYLLRDKKKPLPETIQNGIPVDSSMIRQLRYDPITKELRLTFNTDKDYSYDGVPSEVVTGILEAPSAGRYFNENIRGTYSYRALK